MICKESGRKGCPQNKLFIPTGLQSEDFIYICTKFTRKVDKGIKKHIDYAYNQTYQRTD